MRLTQNINKDLGVEPPLDPLPGFLIVAAIVICVIAYVLGGKRDRAGRPPVADKRIKIWPTVEPDTMAVLSKIAFDDGSSLGEAIDKVTMKFDKKKKRS